MAWAWYLRLACDSIVQAPRARDGRYREVHAKKPVDEAGRADIEEFKTPHFKIVFSAGWHREAYRTDLPRDCRDCQTSCQSACKTSCTVSNQSCPLDNAG